MNKSELTYLKFLYDAESMKAAMLRKLVSKKAEIDSDLIRNPKLATPEKAEELLSLIGEDHAFRDGKKAHELSIRHYLYIFSESIKGFLDRVDDLKKFSRILEKSDDIEVSRGRSLRAFFQENNLEKSLR